MIDGGGPAALAERAVGRPRHSANLDWLFTEHPYLERFDAAREAGFDAVELGFPYPHDAEAIRRRLVAAELHPVVLNLPAGDWEAGDRGLACDPARIEEFRAGVETGIEYAVAVGAEMLNGLSGKIVAGVPREEQWQTLIGNFREAADRVTAAGLRLLIEQANPHDHPGYLLDATAGLERLLAEVGRENVGAQFDCYHVQRAQGNICESFDALADRVLNVQVADVPGRHQPGTGEIDYGFVLEHIAASGYEGHVGLEYVPMPNTLASLGWLKA